MTDNEIIKALLHCAGNGSPCDKCILYDENDEDCKCSRMLKRKAADIINRQQAKIEELAHPLAVELDNFASEYDSKIRAEAINEFAERLKKTSGSSVMVDGDREIPGTRDYWISEVRLDNLVAEMAGDAQ